MDQTTFPIEFNNEVDEMPKADNEFFALAAGRLSQLSKGHTDISSAVVNFKQPAQGRETAHIYEVTIVTYMRGTEQIAATDKSEHLRAALDGALDAVERQVREERERQRHHQT